MYTYACMFGIALTCFQSMYFGTFEYVLEHIYTCTQGWAYSCMQKHVRIGLSKSSYNAFHYKPTQTSQYPKESNKIHRIPE